MARKKFTRDTKGLDAFFEEEGVENNSPQKSSSSDEITVRNSKNEKPRILDKVSFNLDVELSEKIKAYSYEKRVPITNYLALCVEEFVKKIPEEEMDNALKIWRSANK